MQEEQMNLEPTKILEETEIDLDPDLEFSLKEGQDEDRQKREEFVEILFQNNFHFGSKQKSRNKSMSQYVFMTKKGIDMIDLNKTAILFNKALEAIRKCVARGGKVLFVGTESHSAASVKMNAEKAGQYYITTRWLGGLLTNWDKTYYPWILSMEKLEKQINEGQIKTFTKQEQVALLKKRDRFVKFYQGVRDMKSLPNMLVVTSYREKNAIREAEKLKIPVIMLTDTSANPGNIRYLIPGNDSSIKAVELFVSYCSAACLDGLKEELERLEKRKEHEKVTGTPNTNRPKPVRYTSNNPTVEK